MKTTTENRVRRIIIHKSDPRYAPLRALTLSSAKLWNVALDRTRSSYQVNGKTTPFGQLDKELLSENNKAYRALPAKVSKMVLMEYYAAMASFFKLLARKRSGEYKRRVNLPGRATEQAGRVVTFTKQAVNKGSRDTSFKIGLPADKVELDAGVPKADVQFVRVVPRSGHLVVEVGVRVEILIGVVKSTDRVAFIDPGMNNVMTVTSNVFSPLLYSGRKLKSTCLFYIDRAAMLQKSGQSTHGHILWTRRSLEVSRQCHEMTNHLVDVLVQNKIDMLVFGHNKGMKTGINLGRETNKSFGSMPIATIIDQLSYKLRAAGIKMVITEESHTSKCSFLDAEEICHHDKYAGSRVKRGLFKASSGKAINADVNGSLNIGRKYLTKVGLYTEELDRQLRAAMHNPRVVKTY